MNLVEALHVLAVAAHYDNRKPSQTEAGTWLYDLNSHRVTPEEAAAAVREHYQQNPDTWIKSGHVIGIVKKHRRAGGLAHSAQLEAEILRAVEDPDDTRAVIDAIHKARQLAAVGDAVPTQLAITSKYESTTEKQVRRERGAPAAREAAAEALRKADAIRRGKTFGSTGASPAVSAARAKARTERRGGDPEPLGNLLEFRRPT